MDDIYSLIPFVKEMLELHEARANTLVDERTVQFLRDLLNDLQSIENGD
ncbi:MAG: hypothetical protein WAQ27_06370 [Candidatus Microsaccharimonas sp.]